MNACESRSVLLPRVSSSHEGLLPAACLIGFHLELTVLQRRRTLLLSRFISSSVLLHLTSVSVRLIPSPAKHPLTSCSPTIYISTFTQIQPDYEARLRSRRWGQRESLNSKPFIRSWPWSVNISLDAACISSMYWFSLKERRGRQQEEKRMRNAKVFQVHLKLFVFCYKASIPSSLPLRVEEATWYVSVMPLVPEAIWEWIDTHRCLLFPNHSSTGGRWSWEIFLFWTFLSFPHAVFWLFPPFWIFPTAN